MQKEFPTFVILDFETTGFDPGPAEIIEIGAIKVKSGPLGLEEMERYEQLIRPEGEIPREIQQLTGISEEKVETAPHLEDVAQTFLDFVGDLPIVAHNHLMEKGFLDHFFSPLVDREEFVVHNSIDPLALSLPELGVYGMAAMREWAQVDNEDAHRALKDCSDLLKILNHAHSLLHQKRPWMAFRSRMILGNTGWWWNWFFRSDSQEIKEPDWNDLGDLRSLNKQDSEHEPDWSQKIESQELSDLLKAGGQAGMDYRIEQERMSQLVRDALNEGKRLAIEAPTGTGKSLAYLLPGVLSARATGAPLVISTQSKTLQDQLLEKDIPRLQKLMESQGMEAPRAAVVKGQENYLCLRKLNESVDQVLRETTDLEQSEGPEDRETTTVHERWSAAYLMNLSTSGQQVELNQVSRYLKGLFPSLGLMVEDVRSQHSTTIGPRCPYYRQCHFFNSARKAHHSELIIANHSLVFQWPSHLPRIRNLVFDEAHHLENQITRAFSCQLSGSMLDDQVERWLKNKNGGGRKKGDTWQIAKVLEDVLPEGPPSGESADLFGASKAHRKFLTDSAEKIRKNLRELTSIIPKTLEHRSGLNPAFEQSVNLGAQNYPAYPELMDALKNQKATVAEVSRFLSQAHNRALEEKKYIKGQSHGFDLLTAANDRFEQFKSSLEVVLAEGEHANENLLRLLFWHPREESWRLEAAPIQVADLSAPVFNERRSVILTSATLSAGRDLDFVLKRIGLKASQPLVTLPSPYPLAKQGRVYFPRDVAAPGTPEHLEALIDFTEQTVRAKRGKTLLLITSNLRLRQAAVELRDRLEKDGFQVFDSLSDPKAAEHFKQSPKALLIGGEKYGEGLDIPGETLSCVIIEKINEAMTRGPLADARKAQTRFALFDFDFPLRMMWLKQRVGRLIRSAQDKGEIVVFDSRYVRWSPNSRSQVDFALKPFPIQAMDRQSILQQIQAAN